MAENLHGINRLFGAKMILELRSYKNDSTEKKESAGFEIGAVFTRLYGKRKSAVILKLADILVPSGRSYTALALETYALQKQD